MTFSSNSTSLSRGQAAAATGGSNRIKKLPPLLVNQLAAGEVVTRPASVVKELIENAIDAGAKHIDIRITQGGMGIIEVADDGCGIHPDDMIMAVTRFATSKIADVAHLQGIATLGFRGEALAATAAVSRLTLTSCSDDSGIGRELNVAGILEDTPQLIPVVRSRGTTVTVKDLYFNVPARRGNLKSISTEYTHIEMVVKQLALVASDVSFTLGHNDKRRFNFESIVSSDKGATYSTSGSEAMKSTVMQSVLARLTALLPTSHDQAELFSDSNLQPINISLEGLRPQSPWQEGAEDLAITGFLIPSARALSSSSYKLIYINGRLIKDRRISQSIRDSAANLSGINSLGYVLFFNLPKAWLNLNVHPSKQCIKIQNLANVMAHLEIGVRDALQLWQHRQPDQVADYETDDSQLITAATDSVVPNPFADNSTDYFTNYLSDNSTSHLTNNLTKVQQPKSDYQLSEGQSDLRSKVDRDASAAEIPEQELQTLSTQNVAASIVAGTEAAEVASNQLIGLAILDKCQISQALLNKLQGNEGQNDHSLSSSDNGSLLLIQANQNIYLLTQQGLKSGLKSISIDLASSLTSLQSLSELNGILSRVALLSDADHQQLSARAVTQLSFLELASLMIERF
ncbi:DNA mismatch repair endonuclease MutL [Psychrobacter piechaudii]|uniref:DNA mismatch repair protein MutL n=1 Tax=Psychrobacter piechaudii TaxID=1945521 RepID=A0A1R4GY16_9GAMM|nr:DNA mismatch repair endonuclease MutL [Psychrobacter piechaudii]SJM73089.1 DNA mismatch repair protein MutL [Psychrobacter piechaudii]